MSSCKILPKSRNCGLSTLYFPKIAGYMFSVEQPTKRIIFLETVPDPLCEAAPFGSEYTVTRVSRICLKKVSGWQEARLKRHRRF
jgi:hypothetical protein